VLVGSLAGQTELVAQPQAAHALAAHLVREFVVQADLWDEKEVLKNATLAWDSYLRGCLRICAAFGQGECWLSG